MRRTAVRMVAIVGVLVMAGSSGGCADSPSVRRATIRAEGKIMDSYSRYKTEMERTNLERERAGLKPRPIQSFSEWKVAHLPAAPPQEQEQEK